MKLTNEDHLRKAGCSMTKGTKKATNALSKRRMLEATRFATEGTTTAAREFAKSTVKNTTNLFQGSQDTDS